MHLALKRQSNWASVPKSVVSLAAVLFVACVLIIFSLPARAGGQESFSGSATCMECHKAEYKAWRNSITAGPCATAASVSGNLRDVSFTNKNVTTHFSEAGGDYFVETDGSDGRMTKYKVAYTVGVWPLQQYLVEAGNGRLQVLDIAWDVDRKAWYHLYPSIDVSAGNGLHWTGVYKNWQARCAECHQTGFARITILRPTLTPVTGRNSRFPASPAMALLPRMWRGRRIPVAAPSLMCRFPFRNWGQVNRSTSSRCAVLVIRAAKHSRRTARRQAHCSEITTISRCSAVGFIFSDGQQHDEVYVLGSFLQSKMKAKGVTCSNCHEPHSEKLVAEGNAVVPSAIAKQERGLPVAHQGLLRHASPPPSQGGQRSRPMRELPHARAQLYGHRPTPRSF